MLGRHYDCAESIVVLDARECVIGQVSLSLLLELEPGAIIQNVMQTRMPPVFMDTDQERAVSMALQHGLTAVPVVDSERKLCGVIPATALLGVLRREHVEDIHRLAGIARESEMARDAIEAPPVRRVHPGFRGC